MNLKLRSLFFENILGVEFTSTFFRIAFTVNGKVQTWGRLVTVEASPWVPEWKDTAYTNRKKTWPEACEDVSYCLGCLGKDQDDLV